MRQESGRKGGFAEETQEHAAEERARRTLFPYGRTELFL